MKRVFNPKFNVIAEFMFSMEARELTHNAIGKESDSFATTTNELGYCRYEWGFESETDADVAKARLHRVSDDHRIPMNIIKEKKK